jgi:hypothetical protein
MPKPYFLPRPSGLYVRFRVPTDLCSAIGSRFILRSLRGLRGDAARLSAACLAVALSDGAQPDLQLIAVGIQHVWTLTNRIGRLDCPLPQLAADGVAGKTVCLETSRTATIAEALFNSEAGQCIRRILASMTMVITPECSQSIAQDDGFRRGSFRWRLPPKVGQF